MFGQTARAESQEAIVWQGIALGAGAEMRLYTDDKTIADKVINQVQQEIRRLENIFSLYQQESSLSQLNRYGYIENPPAELLTVLVQAKEIHKLTKGKFDPTIQVLWNLYAEQRKQHPKGEYIPPSVEQLSQTLKLMDFSSVVFNEKEVRYLKPGIQMSLNGIAQGYITDKVMEIIRLAGIRRALIDIGEIRGMDLDKQGEWQVGIQNPKVDRGVLFNVTLQNAAIATSGGYGTIFDSQGKFTHLFNPQTGENQPRYQSVTVMAPTAMLADALSTALAVSSPDEIKAIEKVFPQIKVWVIPSTP